MYIDYNIEQLHLRVTKDYDSLSKLAADIVEEELQNNPAAVIGFPTGSTPIGMYKELVKRYQEGRIDFSLATIFNLDEYHPINPKNAQSFAYFMHQHLIDHINIKKENFHIPNGTCDDVEAECQRFDELLEKAGGIHLQVMGVGPNGHIAFNEPSEEFTKKTLFADLTPSTIEANSRFFPDKSKMPRHAISMGIQSLFNAKKILMLVNGEGKKEIVRKMLLGPVTPQVPASILQLHPNTLVMIDEEAALELERNGDLK